MLYAIVAVLILIADQGLKYWVTLHIPLEDGVVELIPGVLELMNIHNYGAAFGILQNAPRWVFILIAVVFAAVVIVSLRRNWIHGKFGRWTAVLVLAGALGNCIDRMLSGYVVDMFNFPFEFPLIHHFAVFNLADIFITVCGILFCLHVLFFRGDKAAPETAGAKAQRKPKTQAPKQAKLRRTTVEPQRTPSAQPAEVGADPDDPFAAWGRAKPAKAKPARPAPKAEPAPPVQPPEPSVPPVQPPKTDFLSHLETDAPADADFDFSLDDILQEFSDDI